MVTSPSDWKMLEWYEKPKKNLQYVTFIENAKCTNLRKYATHLFTTPLSNVISDKISHFSSAVGQSVRYASGRLGVWILTYVLKTGTDSSNATCLAIGVSVPRSRRWYHYKPMSCVIVGVARKRILTAQWP